MPRPGGCRSRGLNKYRRHCHHRIGSPILKTIRSSRSKSSGGGGGGGGGEQNAEDCVDGRTRPVWPRQLAKFEHDGSEGNQETTHDEKRGGIAKLHGKAGTYLQSSIVDNNNDDDDGKRQNKRLPPTRPRPFLAGFKRALEAVLPPTNTTARQAWSVSYAEPRVRDMFHGVNRNDDGTAAMIQAFKRRKLNNNPTAVVLPCLDTQSQPKDTAETFAKFTKWFLPKVTNEWRNTYGLRHQTHKTKRLFFNNPMFQNHQPNTKGIIVVFHLSASASRNPVLGATIYRRWVRHQIQRNTHFFNSAATAPTIQTMNTNTNTSTTPSLQQHKKSFYRYEFQSRAYLELDPQTAAVVTKQSTTRKIATSNHRERSNETITTTTTTTTTMMAKTSTTPASTALDVPLVARRTTTPTSHPDDDPCHILLEHFLLRQTQKHHHPASATASATSSADEVHVFRDESCFDRANKDGKLSDRCERALCLFQNQTDDSLLRQR